MLDQRALVLNRHWVPIGTTSVRDALCLLYRSAARAVDPEDYSLHDFDSWASLRVAEEEPCIRSVSLRIRVPEVVLLTRYTSIPHRKVTFSRKNIYRRDRYTCQYCAAKPPLQDLSVDHVVPRSLGGRSSWTNCVLSCLRCNRKKSSRFPLFHPKAPAVRVLTRAKGTAPRRPPAADPVLLNPRFDDPSRYLTLDLLGTFHFVERGAKGTAPWLRAHHTIETLE